MNNDLIPRRSALTILKALKVTVKMADPVSEVEDALTSIQKVKSIDAIEVVRCRDCENRSPSPFGHPHLRWCKILGDHCSFDFFCGFGKRKEKRDAAD
jgi:hypothetical protein